LNHGHVIGSTPKNGDLCFHGLVGLEGLTALSDDA